MIQIEKIKVGTKLELCPDWGGEDKIRRGEIVDVYERLHDCVHVTFFCKDLVGSGIGHSGDRKKYRDAHWNVEIYKDGSISSVVNNHFKILSGTPIGKIEVKI